MPNLEWYHQHQRKLSKRLFLHVSSKPDDEPLPVIIMLHDDVPHGDEEVRRHLEKLGGKVLRELPIVGGFATVLPSRALAELVPDKKIKQVHLDREAHPCLDIGVPSVLADTVQAQGYTGQGVTIAIVDSGIYPHADFMRPTPRLTGWYDAVSGRPKPYDDHGHGTHVAGIAAGNGFASGGKYRGVAPGANLVGVKVADAEGSAPMSQVIDGLQWVLDNKGKYKIRVVNLSLGSDPSEPYWNDPLGRAVEKLWQEGLVVVAAAGNDGPAPGSIDTPGNHPLIITVGAIDDRETASRQDDLVPDFSSRGPTGDGIRKPEIMAPGVGIMAPQTGGGYVRRTGTSMSTPFTSGAAALILAKESDLSPDQVKQRMRTTADRNHLAGLTAGAGYLNVNRLMDLPAQKEKTTARSLFSRLRGGKPRTRQAAVAGKDPRSQLKEKILSAAKQALQVLLALIVLRMLI